MDPGEVEPLAIVQRPLSVTLTLAPRAGFGEQNRLYIEMLVTHTRIGTYHVFSKGYGPDAGPLTSWAQRNPYSNPSRTRRRRNGSYRICPFVTDSAEVRPTPGISGRDPGAR
jgi:hypothetical protein